MVQQLIDDISDNLYFKDADARIVLVNRANARWLGSNAAEELIGKTDRDLSTEEHASAAFADDQRLMAAEMTEAIGAEKCERVEGRLSYRISYYPRSLITRASLS